MHALVDLYGRCEGVRITPPGGARDGDGEGRDRGAPLSVTSQVGVEQLSSGEGKEKADMEDGECPATLHRFLGFFPSKTTTFIVIKDSLDNYGQMEPQGVLENGRKLQKSMIKWVTRDSQVRW